MGKMSKTQEKNDEEFIYTSYILVIHKTVGICVFFMFINTAGTEKMCGLAMGKQGSSPALTQFLGLMQIF